jgi:hypothetical protein
MYYIVYKITNIVNDKTYIGVHKTENLDDGYMGSGIYLWRAIIKYGIDKFTREILYMAKNSVEMYQKEKELIVLSPTAYNLKNGGNGGFDYINAMEHTRLIDVRPDLVAQLHPTKNAHLDLNKLAYFSHRKAVWICEKGHEWTISIAHRNNGHNCPYCAGKAVCLDNCLETINPSLAKQWHLVKNGNLTPRDVTLSSHCKVWWICDRNHEWIAKVADRSRFGCPYCNGKKVCLENSLAFKFPNLIKEWHPTKNELTPSEVTVFSNKYAYWICKEGHEWIARISARTSLNEKCPTCQGMKPTPINNLAVQFPEIAKEWHPTRNGDLKPTDFLPFSNKKATWQCSKDENHIWISRIADRASGCGCPYCSKHKRLIV